MVFKLLKKILGIKDKKDLQKEIFIKPKYALSNLKNGKAKK